MNNPDCNYNIEVDLLKIEGAKVLDVQGRVTTKRCICIPIDNEKGTVSDSYFKSSQTAAGMVEVKKKGCYLALAAFRSTRQERGQSHLLKPSFSETYFKTLSADQRRQIPFVGNMKPWTPPRPEDLPPDNNDW